MGFEIDIIDMVDKSTVRRFRSKSMVDQGVISLDAEMNIGIRSALDISKSKFMPFQSQVNGRSRGHFIGCGNKTGIRPTLDISKFMTFQSQDSQRAFHWMRKQNRYTTNSRYLKGHDLSEPRQSKGISLDAETKQVNDQLSISQSQGSSQTNDI